MSSIQIACIATEVLGHNPVGVAHAPVLVEPGLILLGGVCCHVRLALHRVLNTPWRCVNRKRSGVGLIEGLPDNSRIFILECPNNACRTTCSIRAKPEAQPRSEEHTSELQSLT